MSAAPETPAQRIDALAHNLHVAADLIGPELDEDDDALETDYVRALAEHTCMASGIRVHHDAIITLLYDITGR